MPNEQEILRLLVEADRAQQGPPPDPARLWDQVAHRLERASRSPNAGSAAERVRVVESKEHEMDTRHVQETSRTWPRMLGVGAVAVALVAGALMAAGLRGERPGVAVDVAAGVPDVVREDLAAISAGDVDAYLAVRTDDAVVVDEAGASRPADASPFLEGVARAPVMGLRFAVEGCETLPAEADETRVSCTIVTTDVLHRAFGTVAIEHDVLYGIRDGRIARTNETAWNLARGNEDGGGPLLRTGLHSYLLREDASGYAAACSSDYATAPTRDCVAYLEENIDAYLQSQ